jgi:hypothetical protein
MENTYTCKPTGKFVEILKIILTVQELVPSVRVGLHNRMKQHDKEGPLRLFLILKINYEMYFENSTDEAVQL